MIKAIVGELTEIATDAIVVTTNPALKLDFDCRVKTVSRAVAWAAGEQLQSACSALPENEDGLRCPTGEARIVPGFNLPAKYVILTVGPLYVDGNQGEREKLSACYQSSLDLVVQYGLADVVFSCIGTGACGYPAKEAAIIAVEAVRGFLEKHSNVNVTFCCYDRENISAYNSVLVG